ncbi:hypothetical protein ANN_10473 [Periplaneta americana]|uniref:Reverse transcriptase domain-containing protein n=1 Tax=Periplaneta americana TaxID=6978 RepID=A0ABQ8TRX5_PERAM|nr:hypothetical protein ANN_10473 [Periplaneta americana]
MSPGSSTESYPAFARIGLRENPGKNLNQVTCPDRDSNPGHLVSQPDALTVTPQQSQLIRVRIGDEMSQGSEIERGVRQGCSLLPIIFNIYLEDLVKNCFQNMGGDEDEEEDEDENEDEDEGEDDGQTTKSIVWAETWTLRRSEEKRIESFEMWMWRKMERVKWTDRIRNEAVLERLDEERLMLKLIR